jgi:hypothetical protein
MKEERDKRGRWRNQETERCLLTLLFLLGELRGPRARDLFFPLLLLLGLLLELEEDPLVLRLFFRIGALR